MRNGIPPSLSVTRPRKHPAKYLELTITDVLEWGQHISEISCKATKTLGFLRRNLALALRHTAPIWHPYNETEIKKNDGESVEDSSQVDLQAMA